MVTAFSLIFSASAVRRMLRLAASVAIQIREFGWVVWVWVAGSRPTFMSKRAFYQHFVDRRKADAQGLKVVQQTRRNFAVSNPAKGSAYTVTLGTAASCTCDDFINQIKFLQRGCCKHGYAVLQQLGFSSLANYQQAVARFSL